MNIRHTYHEHKLVVNLTGEFGPGDADEFLHRLNSLINTNTSDILIDFSHVSVFSTLCLAKLSLFYNSTAREQRQLRFTGLSAQLQQLFYIVDLDFLIVQAIQSPS